jgi:methionyl-tRNA formyltransferase
MRIVFFGLPLAALLLHTDGVDIALAAVSRPKALGMRRLVRLLGDERVVGTALAASSGFVSRVRDASPDLIVSWFWTKRLLPPLLNSARFGAIGVHPSLLPRHRGPDPYFWTIESGDTETGVTAHRLDDAYDTGPILARRTLRVDPSWNAWTLAKRLDRPSLSLLREVVAAYASGRPPPEVPQRESDATLAPEPEESRLALRFHDEASRVVRRVQAASPWPGAFTEIGDALVTLTAVAKTNDFPRALVPGEGAVRSDGMAVIRTLDAAIELRAGRGEDGDELDVQGLARLMRAAVAP